MLVKEPQQGNGGTAYDESKELDVSVLVVFKFVDQDLRASDVDKSATSNAQDERAHQWWSILNADTDTNTCGFYEWKTEENEENGFLGLGLVLAKRDTERDTGCSVMEGNTDHQIHEYRDSFSHAKCYSFKDRMNTKCKKKY